MKIPVFVRFRHHRTSRFIFASLLICLFVAFLSVKLFGGDEESFPDSHFESNKRSRALRQQILKMSEKYVKAVAQDQRSVPDGPYSGRDTAYDLKKTLAVLLESVLQRLDRLETIIVGWNLNRSIVSDRSIEAPSVSRDSKPLGAIDLLRGKQEHCELKENWKNTHPECEEKITWMRNFWKSDPCYARYGVDGSECSFVIYLSEVENYCPMIPSRPYLNLTKYEISKASEQLDIEGLFGLMRDNPTNFQWIKGRLKRMWPKWVQAYTFLKEKQNWAMRDRKKRKILLHLGFLTKESGFKFGEKSLKGGPLGELVQWSDLIAALYILGHDLVISSEIKTFTSFAQADPALKSSCPVLHTAHVDLIYTDIVGLRQMKRKIPGSVQNYKCRLRVLDSFGSHAEFNTLEYFNKHKTELGGKSKNVWGGHKLNLQQFYTMYPHTPDNTFLGFVVETYSNNGTQPDEVGTAPATVRKDWALVYGKEAYMWKDSGSYLNTVRDLLEIHATATTSGGHIPSYVVNHGVVDGEAFHALLGQVKLFLGLGFPYEGPAALEAIANGAVFLNPKFAKPKGRRSEPFFAEKPTLRELHSQNPYAEQFVGPPYVLTIDISNRTAVVEAVQKAKQTSVLPYLPYEFTSPGLLERVNAFVEHQNFCKKNNNWPPYSASQVVLSEQNQSCKDACWERGLICEGSYFPIVNNLEHLRTFGQCNKSESVEEVYAPALDGARCILEKDPLLFSCSSAAAGFRRLCPCRDFIKDQVALCAACL